MKASVKRKWLAALRSGEYEQGQGQLLSAGKYCCLGVLACVVDSARKVWNPPDASFGCFVDGVIPTKEHRDFSRYQEQQKLLGGAIPVKRVNALIKMNDVTKWSFSRIATYIERYI